MNDVANVEEVMQIVDEIHNLDTSVSKTKILTYLVLQCRLSEHCIECPIPSTIHCNRDLLVALYLRELKKDSEKIGKTIEIYNKEVRK